MISVHHILLLLLPISTTAQQSYHALDYSPAILGGGETTDVYHSYFSQIHFLDLKYIKQVADQVVTRHLGTTNYSEFFDHAHDNQIDVIATFALGSYELTQDNFRDVEAKVEKDFDKFIDNVNKTRSVIAVCIGDVTDTYLRVKPDEDNNIFHQQFRILLNQLSLVARKNLPDHVELLVHAWSETLNEWHLAYYADIANGFGVDFDAWVLFVGPMDADALGGLLPSAALGGKDLVVQFARTSYDFKLKQEDESMQADHLMAMISKIEGSTGGVGNGTTVASLRGYSLMEWSDQLWRDSPDLDCGTVQLYTHDQCGSPDTVLLFDSVQYYGLTVQYDQLGQHCIRFRKSFKQLFKLKNGEDFQLDAKCQFMYQAIYGLQRGGIFLLVTAILLIVLIVWSHFKRIDDKLLGSCFRMCRKPQQPGVEMHESVLKDEEHPEREYETEIPHMDEGQDALKIKYTDQYALDDHFMTQQENIDSMIRAMEPDLDEQMAVEVVFNRMIEGYMVWVTRMNHKQFNLSKLEFAAKYKRELVGDDDIRIMKQIHPNLQLNGNRIARMYICSFMYRTITALAEHAIHCPERMAQVFDLLLDKMTGNNVFTIDIDELQYGLDQIHKGEINFDDINDYACEKERHEGGKDIKKSYYESRGVLVILDILRDYEAVFFAKGWLFGFAVYLYHHWRGIDIPGHTYFVQFITVEAFFFFIVEIVLTIYYVTRHRSVDQRKMYYLILGIVAGVVGAFLLFEGKDSELAFYAAAVYALIRFGSFVAFIFGFKDKSSFPGKVGDDKNKIKNVNTYGEVLFWVFGSLITLATEVVLVAPVGVVFTIEGQCLEDPMFPENTYWSQDRFACVLSVLAVYCLLALTVLVDTYLIFNFMVAVSGYLVGQNRLISDVFTQPNFQVKHSDLSSTLKTLFPKRDKIVWEALVTDLQDRFQISKTNAENLKRGLFKNLDISRMHEEPRDRLAFFMKTTRAIRDRKQLPEEQKKDASAIQLKSINGEWIPKITQVITAFQEDVFKQPAFLLQVNGTKLNLDHLISRHTADWQFLEEHLFKEYDEDIRQFVNVSQSLRDFFVKVNQDSYYKKVAPEEILRAVNKYVREWASNRAQTVARTLRGAIAHHRAVDITMGLDNDTDNTYLDVANPFGDMKSGTDYDSAYSDTDIDSTTPGLRKYSSYEQKNDEWYRGEPLREYIETVWAHQLYGKQNSDPNWKQRRIDTDEILTRYRHYPISIVFYWSRPKNLKRPEKDEWGVLNCYGEVIDYWEEHFPQEQIPKEASAVKKWVWASKKEGRGGLEIVKVMPLRRPGRLGPRGLTTQGKACNQMNAVRLVSGNVIQVMDANMDSYIGEGFKVPFVTTMFTELIDEDHGDEESQNGDDSADDGKGKDVENQLLINGSGPSIVESSEERIHRASTALYRVIGFREYIFTKVTGIAGEQMANAEGTFGTIFQRTLATPLNVRMHYGHPDFFDAFWVINRGMLSKGSPHINLSEDVFAGYNIFQRNSQNHHTDILEWQKGREETFYSSSGFMAKTSAGAVGCLRSRDLHVAHRKLMFLRQLSSYFGGISYYVSQLLIDYSITVYMMSFLLLILAGITLHDIGSLHSALGSEWLLSIGFVTMVPLIAEEALERGVLASMQKLVTNFLPSTLFYLFQNKTTAKNFEKSIMTGKAEYVNTGRPTADTHYTTVDAYKFYCATHYYPALLMLTIYVLYQSLAGGRGGVLPMVFVVFTLLCWVQSPVIFCPQIESNLKHDTQLAVSFLMRVDESTDSLYGFWKEANRRYSERSFETRLFSLVWAFMKVGFFFAISYANGIDFATYLGFAVTVSIPLSIMYYYAQKNGFYNGAVYFLWLMYPLFLSVILSVVLSPFSWIGPDKILGIWLLLSFVELTKQMVLMLASACISTRNLSEAERNSRMHEIADKMYLSSFSYHVHFVCGFIIFISQTSMQIVVLILMLLWRCFGNLCHQQPLSYMDWVRITK